MPDAAAYQSVAFGGLAVVGRGTVHADGWLADRDGFRVQAVTWDYAGHTTRLFVLDLPSDVWVARGPLLREVVALMARHRPDLVVGDFNAPRRSWALADLPAGYAHAYHTAGGGWGYTWPVPVPVYALDHCLHGPRVRPVRYELGGLAGNSDHRYQVFDFTPDPAPAAARPASRKPARTAGAHHSTGINRKRAAAFPAMYPAIARTPRSGRRSATPAATRTTGRSSTTWSNPIAPYPVVSTDKSVRPGSLAAQSHPAPPPPPIPEGRQHPGDRRDELGPQPAADGRPQAVAEGRQHPVRRGVVEGVPRGRECRPPVGPDVGIPGEGEGGRRGQHADPGDSRPAGRRRADRLPGQDRHDRQETGAV